MRNLIINCFLFLISVPSFSQDSLYISSDKPAAVHEDNPLSLGTGILFTKLGQITHIKFYSVDAGTYTVNIWSIVGSLLYSSKVQATTGWQRIQLSKPLDVTAGTSYIVSYLTNQKFGYSKNGVSVRTSGSLSKLSTLFSYGNVVPVANTIEDYYVDVVFKPAQERKPLIVNAGPDTTFRLPKDTIINLNGIVSGDSAWYEWGIVDTIGTCTISNLNTLSPTISTREACSVIMVLMGHDKWNGYLARAIQIDILPDPKTVVGELYLDGTFRITSKPNYYLMKNRSQ